MEAKLIKSQKGKQNVALFKGHSYHFHGDGAGGKTIWRCSQRQKNMRCLGRIHLNGKKVILENNKHSCVGPNAAGIQAKLVLHKMKTIASASNEATALVLAKSCEGVPNVIIGQLPKVKSLKKTIQNVRKVGCDVPLINTKDRATVIIPSAITQLQDGQQFLLHDSGNHQDRFLIFSTQRNLDYLSQSKDWYLDGTFKSSPALFDQVFIIHGNLKNLLDSSLGPEGFQ